MSEFMKSMWWILYSATFVQSQVSPYSGMTYAHINARNEVQHYLRQRYTDHSYRGKGNKWRKRIERIESNPNVLVYPDYLR